MGLLDHLLDGFSGPGGGGGKRLRRNVRSGESLLAEGERAQATITGIRVRPSGEHDPEHHEFALTYTAAGGATVRSGCRQRLGELTRELRLGMQVPIRHDGEGQAIVDAPAMGAADADAWGYKPLGSPPDDGIADGNVDLEKERRKADAMTAIVLEVEPVSVFGMPTSNFHVRVRVDGSADGPYEAQVKREVIPFYATHLAEPGTELPALVRPGRPDKVKLDWPAAAVAQPGVGRAPAAVFSTPPPEGATAAAAGDGAAADWSAEGLAADDHDVIAGVSFDTWVAVEAGLVRDRVKPAEHAAYAERLGVAPGRWGEAQSGWQRRMMTDPRVGARFGAEFQAAMKRR